MFIYFSPFIFIRKFYLFGSPAIYKLFIIRKAIKADFLKFLFNSFQFIFFKIFFKSNIF